MYIVDIKDRICKDGCGIIVLIYFHIKHMYIFHNVMIQHHIYVDESCM